MVKLVSHGVENNAARSRVSSILGGECTSIQILLDLDPTIISSSTRFTASYSSPLCWAVCSCKSQSSSFRTPINSQHQNNPSAAIDFILLPGEADKHVPASHQQPLMRTAAAISPHLHSNSSTETMLMIPYLYVHNTFVSPFEKVDLLSPNIIRKLDQVNYAKLKYSGYGRHFWRKCHN